MTKSEQLLLSAVSLWSNGVAEMQIWIHSPMLSPSLCHKSRWDPWMQTQTQTLNFKLVDLLKNFIQKGLLPVLDLMLDDNFFSSVYVGKLVQNEIFLTFFRFVLSGEFHFCWIWSSNILCSLPHPLFLLLLDIGGIIQSCWWLMFLSSMPVLTTRAATAVVACATFGIH